MKKYLVLGLLAAVAVMTVGVTVGLAEENTPVQLTIDGTNYCLLCELSSDDVAEANSTYATINALKVSAAVDDDGNLIDDLEGKTLHYLPTKSAEPLMVGEQHQGASVTVVAEYYKDASAIKIVSYEAASSGWDDLPVGTQSNLQVL